MNIKEFLAKTNLKSYQMARDVGITEQYLTALKNGRRSPSKRLAQDIVIYTRGLVSFTDLFFNDAKNQYENYQSVDEIKENLANHALQQQLAS